MAYVQQFLADSHCSIVENSNANDATITRQETGSISKDHSDEEIKESPTVPYVAKGLKKKHSSKRDKQRRLTQSIPHAPHVFNDFERIGLKAPVNYSELPVVLEKLKTTLKYYEDQTLLPLNFSIPLNDWSYATSESELTVDTDSYLFSVLSLSGVDDFPSSQPNVTTINRNFSQCSLPLKDNCEIINEENQNSPFDNITLKSTIRRKYVRENVKLKKTLSLINFGRKKRSNNTTDRRWSSLESLSSRSNKHKSSTNDEGFHRCPGTPSAFRM
uniref:Uncharacterized protein n=1 Tax=Romanomermis culicivorax TaxID=13658 RepID=A0A915KSN7_ROMCU